jgi:aconitate hydratase
MADHPDSFGARDTLDAGGEKYEIFRLDALQSKYDVARLPYSLKILLENLLRFEDGDTVEAEDVEKVAKWDHKADPSEEIAYTPARVLMQDFTGVPAIVDLAAMRDAMADLGGDPSKINPLRPAELVIDHSIQVDQFATSGAYKFNGEREFERNRERYEFLRWGQTAFDNFSVVPPNVGICHQVNLEYLGRVVYTNDGQAYPDTLVGTDSHTTMINGLGVLGWGVGGIEAEAAMLGQAISMLLPQVIGFKLSGELPEGSTATDLVLTVTQMLREKGVVGKFVEFYGPGLANMPLADRATIGNMSPEMGATCAIFPVDGETLRYLEFSGRPKESIELVEAYTKEQGMFHDEDTDEATYSDTLELDLSSVEPSLAGPKRPQDRVALSDACAVFREALADDLGEDIDEGDTDSDRKPGVPDERSSKEDANEESFPSSDPPTNSSRNEPPSSHEGHNHKAVATAEREDTSVSLTLEDGTETELDHGHVVIAAITSCTNTSNPSVMLGAGLVAKKACEKGLKVKPWVKTSLAPGSKVVTDYLEKAELTQYLDEQGFNLVGYGCTTCIGNSGPLPEEVSNAIEENDLSVCSVLSGNRNFEGRIHPEVKQNYLASPPLVVAYALAGTLDTDLVNDPIGQTDDGDDVYLKDIWPSQQEIHELIESSVKSEMFKDTYDAIFEGGEEWESLDVPEGDRYEWGDESTYVKRAPYFDDMSAEPPEDLPTPIEGAKVLVKLGDSVTTDHISPAGSFKEDTPAGKYLTEKGVDKKDFNSYGSRRGNHEIMMRGTFANVRLSNELVDKNGGWTKKDGEEKTIFDAAMEYQEEDTPLLVLAGKEYGSGSSRDWAAKGPRLLGIKFVLAESYERIHRSNLVGMGILPLQFPDGESADSLGLDGSEEYSVGELEDGAKTVQVKAGDNEFEATVRIDTPNEWLYYRHGGILHYVLRQLNSEE